MKIEKKLTNLKIILVEPNGPINVGSVARLCSNFKVSQLRVVSPRCDISSFDAKRMAVKGIKYLEECKIYKTLEDAILDCDLVLASCGRIDNQRESVPEDLENVREWVCKFNNIKNLALVFGREDRGLTNKELLLAQKVFTIQTDNSYKSLNLSHAVSIVLHEFRKQPDSNRSTKKEPFKIAHPSQTQQSLNHLEELLLKVGYLLPHTKDAKLNKFKKYIIKAQTTKEQINTIRGIVHQINWALDNSEKIIN